jgi:hypothetical protein
LLIYQKKNGFLQKISKTQYFFKKIMTDTFTQTREIIRTNFEIESRHSPESEAELLQELASQIEWMLSSRTEFLFSLLYRHDVDEQKIIDALHVSAIDFPHIGLAKLVLERQKARIEAKKQYKSPDSELLKEFNW